MTREEYCAKKDEAIAQFDFQGEVMDAELYGSGHINDTFLVRCRDNGRTINYILQRMNHEIFKNPIELMENIVNVTSFLRKKIISNHGDPDRETMNIVPTKDGKKYYRDSIGSYWRSYQFIKNALTLDIVERAEEFYESAFAFGNFQNLLSDYPAETLHETIPNFHNTPDRYQKFLTAVKNDPLGRAASVQEEIRFVMEREDFTHTLIRAQKKGDLPLRVTHNDTKLNNVMLDEKTRKAVCVIDLDTVMPGFSVTDFGDSIRFGASTGAEDEPDLTKVNLDLSLFELYTKGYLEGCSGSLTETELDLLPAGAKMMTLECGMRFLTDYLEGDTYFRIHREGHNLDRCRTQFKLVSDMEQHWGDMKQIIDQFR